jgi:hypothetical protein
LQTPALAMQYICALRLDLLTLAFGLSLPLSRSFLLLLAFVRRKQDRPSALRDHVG